MAGALQWRLEGGEAERARLPCIAADAGRSRGRPRPTGRRGPDTTVPARGGQTALPAEQPEEVLRVRWRASRLLGRRSRKGSAWRPGGLSLPGAEDAGAAGRAPGPAQVHGAVPNG